MFALIFDGWVDIRRYGADMKRSLVENSFQSTNKKTDYNITR
jgi:hypothetical protein